MFFWLAQISKHKGPALVNEQYPKPGWLDILGPSGPRLLEDDDNSIIGVRFYLAVEANHDLRFGKKHGFGAPVWFTTRHTSPHIPTPFFEAFLPQPVKSSPGREGQGDEQLQASSLALGMHKRITIQESVLLSWVVPGES